MLFIKIYILALIINSLIVGFFLWLKNKGIEDSHIMIIIAVLTFLQGLYEYGFLLNR